MVPGEPSTNMTGPPGTGNRPASGLRVGRVGVGNAELGRKCPGGHLGFLDVHAEETHARAEAGSGPGSPGSSARHGAHQEAYR